MSKQYTIVRMEVRILPEVLYFLSMRMQKIITFLVAIKAGIKEGVRTIRAFKEDMNAIETIFAPSVPITPNPEIEEISRCTPLAYREAEVLYTLSQDYDIPIELLIHTACNVGSATAMRQLIKEGMGKQNDSTHREDKSVRYAT